MRHLAAHDGDLGPATLGVRVAQDTALYDKVRVRARARARARAGVGARAGVRVRANVRVGVRLGLWPNLYEEPALLKAHAHTWLGAGPGVGPEVS